MYKVDSEYIIEQYAEEISFVEQITGSEITVIHRGALKDIMKVHTMLRNKAIEGPSLNALVGELSDAMTQYSIHHPPLRLTK